MLVPIDNLLKKDKEEKAIPVCILGSTGSIGTSALDFIKGHPALFRVYGLAGGKNYKKLAEQIREFSPEVAVISDKGAWPSLKNELDGEGAGTEILAGGDEICRLAENPEVDLVLAAITGFAGLKPVLSGIRAGKRIALANKESLVAAGQLVKQEQERSGSVIIPVDSEHSAVFQALQGHALEDINKIILTASGGPFLNLPTDKFNEITPEMALKHPKWAMGPKITVDSATMMNKALEVIEAYWLFDTEIERIEVLVHPQSIVHSMVSFVDGCNIAQLSHPDMKGPIEYALLYPNGRVAGVVKELNLAGQGNLEFRALDEEKFPAVSLARQAVKAGGAASAVLNIANEFAVAAFLKGSYPFNKIVSFVDQMLDVFVGESYSTIEDLIDLKEEVFRKMDLELGRFPS